MSWLPESAPPSIRLLPLITCVLATFVAGCSLVPEYQRPDAPMPAAFSGASSSASLHATLPVRAGWWHAYRDPALDALVDDSLTHNYSLAAAVAAVEEARGTAEKVGASQYPSLAAGATVDRSHQGGHHGSNSKSQSVFAEARYEVDFWGLNAANANASALLARASEFDRDTVALTLTASVVDTYFSVQSLHRRLALAHTIADDASHVLQLLLAQQAAGVATELQVQQQRNALATFQAAVPALEQQLEIAQHALAVLTGRAPEQFAVQQVSLASIPIPQPRPDLPASLLQTRPDIRAKEAQVQSANYVVGAARAAFLPGLVLTADGGLASKSLSRLMASPFASIAAALAAPVFDGGALRGQLHASRGTAAKSIADYQQTVITALQEVEDSLTAAHQQELVEAADRSAADAAAKAATLAEAQYRLGTVDFLTVLDAQRTRFQSEDTLMQARLARLQASVSVFRAFGGGFGVTDAATASPDSSTNLSRS
ncbi:putative multidrug efflux system outer membrane subunit [Paraburkholderia piptadeniae]|uniref:Multidrug efflux system outer membrane subunit n=1 Tax=Paraburkholderia piptadeniae TaxID=1701573 RepID=A0A1N7SKB3_9BURK|nr:efflux transporter outer membrane subunit [Paraburkholderia piptadeniae]SIT47820.1 putative multidrug efflux system outer membrane subunit [Paraburkholderia piptadeniae]